MRDKRESLLDKYSQLLIEFAGKHPKIKTRLFEHLRVIREFRIKDAKEFQITSQRPRDNDLKLHSIFVFEIYFTEAYSKLEKGLDEIYGPGSNRFNSKDVQDYKEFINETATSLTSIGAYINLPILHQINKNTFQSRTIAINKLPTEIRYIQLQLYKTLPSFIILSAQVIFEDPINAELDKIINGYYEGKVSLKSLRKKRFGYSWSLPEKEKRQAIKSYIDKLQDRVEKVFSKHFEGFFLSAAHKCPSLEVYTISKIDISDDLVHWRTKDKDFWQIMGFEWPYQDLIFSGSPFTLFIDHGNKTTSSHKLIANIGVMDAKNYGSIDGSIIMETSYLISEYSRSFLFIEILNEFLNKAKYLNVAIENTVNEDPKKGFRKIIELSKEIFKSSMKTEKLINEFKDLRIKLPSFWKSDQYDLLNLRKRKKLADFLLESIEWKMDILQNPSKMIDSHAGKFLNNKNIQINYSLQRSLRFLSLVLLIATIVQILIAMKLDIGMLLNKITNICESIYSILR